MDHVGDAVHYDFEWNRYLLLDLLGGNSRPLRNEIHVVVGNIRIRFYGKLMERDRAPKEQQDRSREEKKAILQRKIDEFLNHLLFHRVLEHECVLNYLHARADARDDFLHISREHVSAADFRASKFPAASRNVNPIPVMQV